MKCTECGCEKQDERSSMMPLRTKIERHAAGVDSENPDNKVPKRSNIPSKQEEKYEDSGIGQDLLDELKGMTINTVEDIEEIHQRIMEYLG